MNKITCRVFMNFVGAASAGALLISLSLALALASVEAKPNGHHNEKRIDSLIKKMSLDEKIGMMGLVKSSDGYENVSKAVPRLGIPRLILQDGPAGVGADFTGVTQLPAPIAVAASWDRSVARRYGKIQGSESWGKGIEVAQGPDVNIARAPQNGRTFEAYGEDPYLTTRLAVANIKGIQSQGPMANVKHFVANNQEINRRSINEVISARTLREIYYPAFKAAVQEANVGSMMCAYNQVNGRYSCQNPHLLTKIFKGEWGFKGFIRSDYGAVHSTMKAFQAGMDQAKPRKDADGKLKRAVKNGQVSEARINDAVRHVLREMFRFGLIKHPPEGTPDTKVTSPRHAALARRIAEQGTVLLKNGDGILPLDNSKIHAIVVIGPDGGQQTYTAGGGSSHVIAPYVITPYDGIKKRAGAGINVTYTQGISPKHQADSNLDLSAAEQAAKKADVAIVFANDEESEGHDRPNLQLPHHQNELIEAVAKANPNTVVVLNTGGPVAMPWVNKVKGVVEAWYAGQEAGNAIASVLFGDTNPSGKLPITFAKSATDYPANTKRQYPGVNGVVHYSEGIDVGYRHFDQQGIKPLFLFGYGLSYTTFKLSDLEVAPKQLHPAHGQETVHVKLTNTGKRAGAEVVQLYVGMPKDAGEPPKQLKGFEKVHLKPGETKRVSFALKAHDLSYWNAHAHKWVMVRGDYRIMVGTSSRDIALSRVLKKGK